MKKLKQLGAYLRRRGLAVKSRESRTKLAANALQASTTVVSVVPGPTPVAEPLRMMPDSRLAWCNVARGLAVRTYQRRPLREMLLRYVCDLSADREQSSLHGQSESQLQFIRLALAAELLGAVNEVADRSSGRTAEDLYDFEADLVDGCFGEVPDALLQRWVRISRTIGVSDADFLYSPR